ncbi:MAG TPA: DUF2231 domain-containing protein [Bdellovibrionales bacterium]|nr:DUF2231 domain-containing protein [Bdellovibrionales bacterium]
MGAQLHLFLNHFPVAGMILATALWIFFRNNPDNRRLVLKLFIVLAVLGLGTYLSGEPAEEVVEHLQGFSHDAIEAHEEAAVFPLVGMILLALASVAGLVLEAKRGLQKWVFPTVLVLSLLTVAMVLRTAKLGGEIRHTELLQKTEN